MGPLLIAAMLAATPVDCARDVPKFMDGYAADLRAGDRAAIAARYSRSGAYLLGFEAKRLHTPAEIAARYAGPGWQKPDGFAWNDLTVETAGPDACLVTGGFTCTAKGRSAPAAYTGLLVREDGMLRLRIEHENLLPPSR